MSLIIPLSVYSWCRRQAYAHVCVLADGNCCSHILQTFFRITFYHSLFYKQPIRRDAQLALAGTQIGRRKWSEGGIVRKNILGRRNVWRMSGKWSGFPCRIRPTYASTCSSYAFSHHGLHIKTEIDSFWLGYIYYSSPSWAKAVLNYYFNSYSTIYPLAQLTFKSISFVLRKFHSTFLHIWLKLYIGICYVCIFCTRLPVEFRDTVECEC